MLKRIVLVGEHAPPRPLGGLRRIGAKRAPILERYRSIFNPKGVRKWSGTPGVWGRPPVKGHANARDERASHAICEGLRSSPELCVRTHVSLQFMRAWAPDYYSGRQILFENGWQQIKVW